MTGDFNERSFVPADTNRLVCEADTISAFTPEKLLDNAVFQRVKRNDRESTAGCQRLYRLGKENLQRVQLMVYGDAQRLESPSGGMNFASYAVAGFFYGFCQLQGAGEGSVLNDDTRDVA